jgi:hypothetical protein
MGKEILYEPARAPVVGGFSATFPKWSRDAGRPTAIAATKRVLAKDPYVPTGDEAFDLRAKAFRAALERGEPKAFEESHDAFTTVGLYSHFT